jgi:hypothetical protein
LRVLISSSAALGDVMMDQEVPFQRSMRVWESLTEPTAQHSDAEAHVTPKR